MYPNDGPSDFHVAACACDAHTIASTIKKRLIAASDRSVIVAISPSPKPGGHDAKVSRHVLVPCPDCCDGIGGESGTGKTRQPTSERSEEGESSRARRGSMGPRPDRLGPGSPCACRGVERLRPARPRQCRRRAMAPGRGLQASRTRVARSVEG